MASNGRARARNHDRAGDPRRGHGKVTILLDEQGEVRAGAAAHRGVPRLRALHPGPALLGGAGARAAAVRHLPGQPPPGGGQGHGPDRRRREAHADGREDAPADALRADVPVPRAALLPPGLARPALRLCGRATASRAVERNVIGVAAKFPELAVQGVMMRKYGQEIIKATAGKKIHGTGAIPGGVNKNLSIAERDVLLKDVDQMLDVGARRASSIAKDYTVEHLGGARAASAPSTPTTCRWCASRRRAGPLRRRACAPSTRTAR